MKTTEKTTAVWIWTARILSAALCVAWTVWIFSNSLKTASESSEQSGGIFEAFKTFWVTLFPSSSLSDADAETLDAVHGGMRNFAHFAEFCLLGGIAALCTFTFSQKIAVQAIPIGYGVAAALADEVLQIFTEGRAFEWLDLGLDVGGVSVGVVAVVLVLFALRAAWKKKGEKVNG